MSSPRSKDSSRSIPHEIPARFNGVFSEVAKKWGGGSPPHILKLLVGGKSGASVTIVDIQGTASGSTETLKPGNYVLKLDETRHSPRSLAASVSEPSESERHNAAVRQAPKFAESHIPALVSSLEIESDRKYFALLYDIAGSSYSDVVCAFDLSAAPLSKCCKIVSRDLLAELNPNIQISSTTGKLILSDWLGYRLDPQCAPALHENVQSLTNDGSAFALAGEVLINPLWLCTSSLTDAPFSAFAGFIHGDLHPGNILLSHQESEGKRYWIIDFALFRPAPIFYDHAYLEYALLHQSMDGLGMERLYGILRALDADPKTTAARDVPPTDVGVLDILRQVRIAAKEWQNKYHEKRVDTFVGQQLLARVAIGLNWANKPLSDQGRVLAIGYAGWAAKQYLQRFHRDQAASCLADTRSGTSSKATPVPLATVEAATKVSGTETWDRIWREADKFDEAASRFILISGRLRDTDLASLGLLPWCAVVDFDPTSDNVGLLSKAGPVLKKLRFLKLMTRRDMDNTGLFIQAERSTSWFMAGGWPSRFESIPSEGEWRRNYVPLMRRLFTEIRRLTWPQVIKTLVLPGPNLPPTQLALTLATIDEVFQDSGKVMLVSDDDNCRPELVGARFDLNVDAFVSQLRRIYGAQDNVSGAELPGLSEPVPISIEQLRDLQTDLEVLHSRILMESAAQPRDRDDFWRGTPPSWSDLHANLDAPRSVQVELNNRVSELLHEGGNHTVEFHHMPGAGGTTVVLRCAWTHRLAYPVVVLQHYSGFTADRIAQVFQLSQKPVLIVADASLIPVANREDLFGELASRHVRSVILYVVRTLKPGKHALKLLDPMDPAEAKHFLQIYSARTSNSASKRLLMQITQDPQQVYYRSAFFYGLLTYESGFRKIENYVSVHLEGIQASILKVLCYLAIVTKYAQIGIDESTVRLLCGFKPDSAVDADQIFANAGRLIRRSGRAFRLMHPLIAEQVLAHGSKGAGAIWKARLKDLAISFICDFVTALGTNSQEVQELFVQLFIRRDLWARGKNFSELLSDIETPAGRHEVLTKLTELVPGEAHFWNHLGRHQIYEMRSHYDLAEQYLEKAVSLSPQDSLHFHALGMVRRFWIEQELDKLFASAKTPHAEDVLGAVEKLAASASDAFQQARKLRKADEHGYVTNVQMIAEIAERLMMTPELQKAGGLQGASGHAASWLQHQLVVANDLLDQVRQFRPEVDSPESGSHLILTCEENLAHLLGSLDQLIGSWESIVHAGKATNDLRRALTTVYLRRGNKIWSSISSHDLRQIVEHAEANLRAEPGNSRDAIVWLHAYRRLPEFSYVRALDIVGTCAAHAKTVDCYYYLFILHFLLWRNGSELDEVNVKNCMDQMKSVSGPRRDYSYEWLANSPSWCPLAHYRDLGNWRPSSGTPNPSLAFENGFIDKIDGPQAGKIRLGKQTVAFFIPGANFHPTSDINQPVHFYLGFSHDGLRAWNVNHGPAPKQTS